jgi:hypothetical protein
MGGNGLMYENPNFTTMNHPYVDLEKTSLWNTVSAAITDLEKNRDIRLTATQQHVVGYICKQLVENSLTNHKAETKPDLKR